VRVTTAFNRVLSVPGTSVSSVSFTESGLVLGVRRRARRHRCPCGWSTASRYDVSRRRWRHLDFGATRVWLEAEIARLDCRGCGRVRTEDVPWARPGARATRDFEDMIAWLAQRMDKTSVSRLLRCAWQTVDRAVKQVVADHLDDTRLDRLSRIGVDEVSHRLGHRYLTVVADHDTGRVVWVARDRSKQAFAGFFDALGEQRSAALSAITCDAAGAYQSVARARAVNATICLDPFHVIKWANDALDAFYRSTPALPTLDDVAGWKSGQRRRPNWQRLRVALRTGGERLDERQHALITAVRRHSRRLWRAWQLKEELRELYHGTDPAAARAYLNSWITAALRSRIGHMQTLARRLRKHFDAVIAAVELGLSNSRLEGINTKIRVIQRRGYGHRNPDTLTAMIYLCLGGIDIPLPTQT
jgi:transposase